MTAAIYARFSTDRQSENSTEDQARLCRAAAERLGIIVATVHADDGISGSTPIAHRPGGKRLLADVLAKRFDVLIVEALDRLSRDQVDLEQTVRRIERAGIRIVGVSDGYDSTMGGRKLVRTMRGLIGEMYLDDLREKTHRGLVGQFARGYIVGGHCFGYRILRDEGGSRYEIDEAQARWVRQIFDRYAAGEGVQRIAHDLNRQGAPAPRGRSWAVSAIYGSPVKGAGILNNQLYAGRYVWNRSQWLKDPDTGKRQRIERPRHEWLEAEVPELRIVADDVWQAVRARIDDGRDATTGRKRECRPVRTLFGGLMGCPRCGAPMIAISATRYGCHARKDRGPAVCEGFTISRRDVDQRLLSLVRDDLLSPGAAMEFERAYRALMAEQGGDEKATRARAAALDGEIARLVDAIATMGLSDALQGRLRAAEAERAALRRPHPAALPAPRIREQLAALLVNLRTALERDAEQARMILAELLGRIDLEVRGEEVWARLETGRALKVAAGRSITVVAGAGFEPATFGL